MIAGPALGRLLQLASPLLPVGAYSYSQGLEWAIEDGTVADLASARAWIGDVLDCSLGSFELPVLARLCLAWADNDTARIGHWNEVFIAARDTAESRAETLQMGYSLRRLLILLRDEPAPLSPLQQLDPVSFPAAWACATTAWEIPPLAAGHAYAWSWLENQVSAAMKALPLGQTDGQRLLLELGANLQPLVMRAYALPDDDISSFAPGLSIAGCRHETQYTRLFRS